MFPLHVTESGEVLEFGPTLRSLGTLDLTVPGGCPLSRLLDNYPGSVSYDLVATPVGYLCECGSQCEHGYDFTHWID